MCLYLNIYIVICIAEDPQIVSITYFQFAGDIPVTDLHNTTDFTTCTEAVSNRDSFWVERKEPENSRKNSCALFCSGNYEQVLEGTEPSSIPPCYIKGGWSQAANKGEWA